MTGLLVFLKEGRIYLGMQGEGAEERGENRKCHQCDGFVQTDLHLHLLENSSLNPWLGLHSLGGSVGELAVQLPLLLPEGDRWQATAGLSSRV